MAGVGFMYLYDAYLCVAFVKCANVKWKLALQEPRLNVAVELESP